MVVLMKEIVVTLIKEYIVVIMTGYTCDCPPEPFLSLPSILLSSFDDRWLRVILNLKHCILTQALYTSGF